ncbi:MAG: acyltransferase [Bacteroidetes bacterium]|nr:acyltransferase [Bacteroidota bacterium]
MRFICATGVIFHHTWLSLSKKGFVKNGLHAVSGAFFLDVFFIISGFLISLILLQEIKKGSYHLKNFYMRRMIRIWPLFFLAVFLGIIVFPLKEHVSFSTIKTNLLYACSFSVNYQLICEQVSKTYTILWSVCIEEHIYLLLPFFLFLFKKNIRSIAFLFIILGFLSWLIFSKIPSASGYNTAYFMSTSYFYFFGIGALMACFFQKIAKEERGFLFSPTIQILVFIFGGFYVFNRFHPSSYSLPVFLISCGLLGAYLVGVAVQKKQMITIKPTVTRYLGNVSYAMYLVHIPMVGFVLRNFIKGNANVGGFKANILAPCMVTLCTLVWASILHYFFERYFLKLKAKYTRVLNK